VVQLASEAVEKTRALKLIVLDRDGVINHDSDQFIKSPDEWRPIPGSLEAIARLNHAGYRVIVATNQSGVGRGLVTREEADAVHRRFLELLAGEEVAVAGVYYCFHAPGEGCDCRKPRPGLLTRAVRELGLGSPRFMVGDKPGDVGAGAAAGCTTIWLGRPGAYPADEPAPDFQAAGWDDVLAFIRGREE
jgi:D-glycero-D-manno-heptose 1,7-bisphosphate phosphatase